LAQGNDLRVALDARFIGFAGIGRFVEGLWRGLIDIGTDVVGLWPAGPPRDWLGADRPAAPGRQVPVKARPYLPAEQLSLPRALRDLDAAVHHAPNWAVPYLTKRPVVLTVHDLYPYLNPSIARSAVTATVYRTVIPLAIRKARMVVAVSPLAARQLQETFRVGEDRLRVVEHGIDHERWRRPGEAVIAEVRQHYDLPAEYLFYVGTIKPHKNLKMLLSAHGPEHPPLVLAGPTASEFQESELSDQVRGRVIPVGRVQDELPALYAGALALLLPSIYESVGFPALEAMACRTPVVCSDGGGLPETVGDGGLIVPVADTAAWREALTAVSEQEPLRHRLAAAGAEVAGKRSWRDAAERYMDIYREAAG
jgi:glycosyltransferase involved in cell wall biosynthesis